MNVRTAKIEIMKVLVECEIPHEIIAIAFEITDDELDIYLNEGK